MNLVVCPPLWCSYTQWKEIVNLAKRTLWILSWKPTEEWTTWIDSLLSLLPCKRYNKACIFFSNSKLCIITKPYLMLFFLSTSTLNLFQFSVFSIYVLLWTLSLENWNCQHQQGNKWIYDLLLQKRRRYLLCNIMFRNSPMTWDLGIWHILVDGYHQELRVKIMREEEKREKEEELVELEETVLTLKQQNEKAKRALSKLENVVSQHQRNVEKQRKLAETQFSYRICLERMIRDTMHQ